MARLALPASIQSPNHNCGFLPPVFGALTEWTGVLMSKLLDERPIVIQPSVVKVFGFERAVILQQIHFHLESPKSGKLIGGHKWIWNTYNEWAEELPFWQPRTVRKWMTKLEDEGLIVTGQFDKADWNRRKYYRIDYDRFKQVLATSKRHDDDTSENSEDDASKRHDDDTSKRHRNGASYKEAETSTETSTESVPPCPSDPIDELTRTLFDLHGITDSSGWRLQDSFRGLAVELHGIGSTPDQVVAFFQSEKTAVPVRFFAERFATWRAKNGNAHSPEAERQRRKEEAMRYALRERPKYA